MKGFPEDFLWGASTAAYQVEGGNHTQWTEWEQKTAEQRAQTAEQRYKHLSVWPSIRAQAEDPSNYLCSTAVDHYNRYKEDFDTLKGLNLNSFRFGIEWARLQPNQGEWDNKEIEHYRQYIAELKQRGIEPILNIWHWTMPTWFTDMGAFERRENIKYLTAFVEKVIDEYGDELKYVITLNEPNSYAFIGYLQGMWPPHQTNPLLFRRVYKNLMCAHKEAYRIIKNYAPHVQVGIAQNIEWSQPLRNTPWHKLVAHTTKYIWGWWFLDKIKNYQDFVGVNYYMANFYNWRGQQKNPKDPRSDLGWYMDPNCLEFVIEQAADRYKKPIIVTENGVAEAAVPDEARQWWLEETIGAMSRAIESGVELKGYMHWSLLDNFEWAEGFWPKFGLVAVDRATMQRTVKPSAKWLASKLGEQYSTDLEDETKSTT